MKKLAVLLLLATLVFPVQAFAASDQIGVYVAPKFVYGIAHFKMKGTGTDIDNGVTSGFSDSMGSHTESAFGGALAIGYDFSKRFDIPVRAELEYALFGEVEGKYTDSYDEEGTMIENTAKGKVGIQSLFANVYYDFRNESKFTPYVGAGIGMGIVSMKGSASDSEGFSANLGKKTQSNFAWNLGVGCAYEFTQNIAVDLGYRYANFGKAKTNSFADEGGDSRGEAKNIDMHQFTLGARFTF